MFRAALFAPEPARERLMVLYAFDIELSRSLTRTTEPMIGQMRLQWWRDVLDEAASGAPARAHEVAGPLHALLSDMRLPREDLDALVDARGLELAGITEEDTFAAWSEKRFAALLRLASSCLGVSGEGVDRAAVPAGRAWGVSLALRLAAPMVADGQRPILPLTEDARAELSRGSSGPAFRQEAARTADMATDHLRQARAEAIDRRAHPAFYPLTLEEPVLRSALSGAEASSLTGAQGGTLRLLWASVRGRW